jgi:hypothetical protein
MKLLLILTMVLFSAALASFALAAACDIGEIACADDSCNADNCALNQGKKTGSCNNNGACDSGEECGCRDCILDEVNSSCSSGYCSSSGFCMNNCTISLDEPLALDEIFSFIKKTPATANVFVDNFNYWIVDEYGNQIPVEVSIKIW